MSRSAQDSQLELALTRTLHMAAAAAPEPDLDFPAGVRARQGRRRHRGNVILAGCAAALTVVGSLTVVQLSTATDPPPLLTGWSGTLPEFDKRKSPELVWPDAVHRLPEKLPDGRRYMVAAVLGEQRYLVDVSFQVGTISAPITQGHPPSPPTNVRPAALWEAGPAVFDARANTVRPLGDAELADTAVVTYLPRLVESFVVGDRAVWQLSALRDGGRATELWSSRLDGVGGPRLLHTFTKFDGAASPKINVAGDTIFWRQDEGAAGPGLYQLPVTGGTPTLVPGSEKFYPMDLSPWAYTRSGAPSTPPGGNEPAATGLLWNLATGDRHHWEANPATEHISCDPVLCQGQTADGRPVVQRLDGTDYQVLPFPDVDAFHMWPALDGTFATGYVSGELYVWDRLTGRTAVIVMTPRTIRPGPTASAQPPGQTTVTFEAPQTGPQRATVQWGDGEGGIYVLDLKAIR